jgi:SecA preprotein cross-linking domain/SecA DEAD-like domain
LISAAVKHGVLRLATDTATGALIAVLCVALADGRQELTLRHTATAGPLSTGPPTVEQDQEAELGGYATLTAPHQAAIPQALKDAGLMEITAPRVTLDQAAAAVPAVLWAGGDRGWGRFITTALKAVHLYVRDVDYIVKDSEVVIIDSATGREKRGSRWQGGVHQAIEAKEAPSGTRIRAEDFDQGRITYQVLLNYYGRLSGMTGTAATEAEEFGEA